MINCTPKHLSRRQAGFTLIEVLVALTVFAILAGISASILYYVFNAKSRVSAQAERLLSLQLAISLLERDAAQTVRRAIRGNEMRLFPPFIGQGRYTEWTRGGLVNPRSVEKKSSLQRVAWLCEKNQLIRRTWESLDPIDRGRYQDKIVLSQLSQCDFHYLNQHLEVLSSWSENALSQNQKETALPKALQLTLTLEDWGKGSFLFPIPKAMYAEFK